MPAPTRPPARHRAPAKRRKPPRRRGFRIVTLLAVVAATAALAATRHHPASGATPLSGAQKAAALARSHAREATLERNTLDRLIRAGHPVYCGGDARPLVALTFDDGPGPLTPKALDLLHEFGIRATFFIVGKEISAWPSLKGVPRREARAGAIGNHTYDHISLVGLSQDELEHQLGDAQDAIRQATRVPVRLFRPPLGQHDAATDAAVRGHDMLQVLWSVDSQDSMGAGPGEIVRTIRQDARPGSIILMHENRGQTLQAFPRIMEVLRHKGLRPVTVPELLAHDPPTAAQLRQGSCG
jgi:peptidoglycan/xylan/chitin deacetylase (PgdA/CDA1 family)